MVSRIPDRCPTGPSRAGPSSVLSRVGRTGPEVDPQGEDAIVERGVGVADHGVVHEVRPGLVDEPFAVRALDRWDTPLADGPGPRLETLDHGIDVELLGHTRMLTG